MDFTHKQDKLPFIGEFRFFSGNNRKIYNSTKNENSQSVKCYFQNCRKFETETIQEPNSRDFST